jgi:molybdate transport system substrate-binding protein
MKKSLHAIRMSAIAAVLTLPICGGTNAADVNVFASLAIKPVIEAIGPAFEKTSGHKLLARFELTPAVKRQIEAGEAFDVAIANPSHIEDLIKQGKIAAGSRADIVRFGVGVGVRAGAPRRDVSSADALRRTLLAVQTVAYVGEGTSGVFVRGLLDRLGIAEAMKDKLKPAGVAASLASVAAGEAEIVVMPIPLILSHSGVELTGVLAEELQEHIIMTAGLGASPKDPAASRAFIEFLRAAEVTAVVKAKGYERLQP